MSLTEDMGTGTKILGMRWEAGQGSKKMVKREMTKESIGLEGGFQRSSLKRTEKKGRRPILFNTFLIDPGTKIRFELMKLF